MLNRVEFGLGSKVYVKARKVLGVVADKLPITVFADRVGGG